MDREYIIAGFTGVLFNSGNDDKYIEAYPLSQDEQFRAACVAVQGIMQGINGDHMKERGVSRVAVLSWKFNINAEKLEELAWNIVRGCINANDEDDVVDILLHVMRYFLKNAVPQGEEFGYTGTSDAFDPRGALDIMDLVFCDRENDQDFYETSLSVDERELLATVEECCGRKNSLTHEVSRKESITLPPEGPKLKLKLEQEQSEPSDNDEDKME